MTDWSSPRFRGLPGLALAKQALELLVQHNVPITPANFEVWITHVAGGRSDLSAEIKSKIESKEGFTDEISRDLFERFFVRPDLSAEMLIASDGIALELSSVIATLRAAGEDAGSFSRALDKTATSFDINVDASNFRVVLNGLASAARGMADRNRQLSEQMASSARQVETLQATLQTVKVEALTDSLTGLANRKLFDETLGKHFSAPSGDLCLLMCDIDHFKRFNDSWGHLVGDQVIRYIAQVLSKHASGEYLAARYGGEEFAIIMPRTNLHRAQEIAAAVNQSVKAKRMTRKTTGESIGGVTISTGIARRRLSDSVTDLIARADACLYASKRGGRDRVTIDSDLTQVTAA